MRRNSGATARSYTSARVKSRHPVSVNLTHTNPAGSPSTSHISATVRGSSMALARLPRNSLGCAVASQSSLNSWNETRDLTHGLEEA